MRQRERLAEAKRRGAKAGRAAASWVFDGNTTQVTRDAVARGLADGDPETYGAVQEPAWLSGEWVGESASELLSGVLWATTHDSPDALSAMYDKDAELCAAYEEAASRAWKRCTSRPRITRKSARKPKA